MKRYIVAMFLALTLTTTLGMVGGVQATAQPELVYPTGWAVPTDPELKNLQWNRYTTPNFTILSIDDSQGKWLAANLEKIKTWCVTRWGFPDFKFSKECRVMCVPNKNLMKKLFNLTESRCEVRRNKDGGVDMTVMWLILDDKPAKTVPIQLSQVAFAEFENTHNVKFGWYARRGMSILNGTPQDIRQHLAVLGNTVNRDSPVFVSEKMFTMTEEDYAKAKQEDQMVFDSQAVALCLMLRKEFGEAKMQGFMRLSSRNNPQSVLQAIYGFRSYQHFDASYARYMRDLTNDIARGKTPDLYLEIRPVRR